MSFPKSKTRGWPVADRLAFYSERDTSGCILWRGNRDTCGYGTLAIGGRGRSEKAHRLAWKTHVGPIPAGLYVLHRCDVPSCINVDHLFLGTHDDNMADKAKKLRGPRKITPDTVQQIRAAVGTQREIARAYGVSQTTVCYVRNGVTWKYV